MPRCLVLQSGSVISERNEAVTIESNFSKQVWRIQISGRETHDEISEADVNAVISKPYRKELPWSTYYPQSSSPANSLPATTSPIPNTPTTPPHALVFLQESLASLETQVGSIRKFLAATFQ